MMGMGINEAKVQGALGGAWGVFSADTETRRPVIMQTGTADKTRFPGEMVIAQVTALEGRAGDPCGLQAGITIEGVISCFFDFPLQQGLDKKLYLDRGAITRDWLVTRMNANPRGIESLYPDLGHAAGLAPAQQDRTVTVRQDYPAQGDDSAPVAVLTAIDGSHEVPGARGEYPPCGGNCDIDMVREILQFWRAHAGLVSLWR